MKAAYFALLLGCVISTSVSAANAYPAFANSKITRGISTNAQVALFWNGLEGGIRQSKNIKSVGHPATGIYCVHLAVKLDLAQTYPIVTTEWLDSTSHGPLGAIAEYGAGFDCKHDNQRSTIAIRTYDYSSGSPVLSDDVNFYLLML
jgi:hypothetical protein